MTDLETLKHRLAVVTKLVDGLSPTNTDKTAIRNQFKPLVDALTKVTGTHVPSLAALVFELESKTPECNDFLNTSQSAVIYPLAGRIIWHDLLAFAKQQQVRIDAQSDEIARLNDGWIRADAENISMNETLHDIRNQLASRPRWKTIA